MKNSISILLLLAVAMAVAVDAGRSRKHRSNVRAADDDNVDSPDLPAPDQIHHFDVPDIFTQDGPHGDATNDHDQNPDEETRPPKRGHRQRHG